jgi:hypothetical protein
VYTCGQTKEKGSVDRFAALSSKMRGDEQLTGLAAALDEVVSQRNQAAGWVRRLLGELTELCDAAIRRVEQITFAANNKLSKLQQAVEEQAAATLAKQELRVREFAEQQQKAHDVTYHNAHTNLLSTIERETENSQRISAARVAVYNGRIRDERQRVSDRWGVKAREVDVYREREGEKVHVCIAACDHIWNSTRREEAFVRDAMTRKHQVSTGVVHARSAKYGMIFSMTMEGLEGMTLRELGRWVDIVYRRRVHEETKSTLELTVGTVELQVGLEQAREARGKELEAILTEKQRSTIAECQEQLDRAHGQFMGVLRAQEEACQLLKSRVQTCKSKLEFDYGQHIRKQELGMEEVSAAATYVLCGDSCLMAADRALGTQMKTQKERMFAAGSAGKLPITSNP